MSPINTFDEGNRSLRCRGLNDFNMGEHVSEPVDVRCPRPSNGNHC